MKGLILSGGHGTRLRPITYTNAKQLVPVANKPILFYALEAMAQAGIKQVGIIIGHTGPEVMRVVGDGKAWGLQVSYIAQDQPLGLAHCVLIAQDFLGTDDFVMYLGDNLLRRGILPYIKEFQNSKLCADNRPTAHLLLAKVENARQFGVATLNDEGEVVRLVEKPQEPESDLALVGMYIFDQHIHTAVRKISPSGRNELEITDAIQWLIDDGAKVSSQVIEGWWVDTGNLEALLEGNRLVLDLIEPNIEGLVDEASVLLGTVVIQPGARVENCTIEGPVIIGKDAYLKDCHIKPFTSIQNDCNLQGCKVQNSILLEASSVFGSIEVKDSLIGKSAQVVARDKAIKCVKLMIGDSSKVDLTKG